MEALITAIYLANSVIACLAYLPQCMTLWRMLKTDAVNTSVSLTTWLLWSWACSVTLLYAWVMHRSDLAFLAISAVNEVFCLVTVWLTVRVHIRVHQKNRELIR